MTEKNINCTNDVGEVYHMGDVFEYENELYILCNTEYNKVQLLCIQDGRRWSSSIEVKNIHQITKHDNAVPSGFRKVKQLNINYDI